LCEDFAIARFEYVTQSMRIGGAVRNHVREVKTVAAARLIS